MPSFVHSLPLPSPARTRTCTCTRPQAILVAIGAMNMTTNALRARVLAAMEFLSLCVLVLTM